MGISQYCEMLLCNPRREIEKWCTEWLEGIFIEQLATWKNFSLKIFHIIHSQYMSNVLLSQFTEKYTKLAQLAPHIPLDKVFLSTMNLFSPTSQQFALFVANCASKEWKLRKIIIKSFLIFPFCISLSVNCRDYLLNLFKPPHNLFLHLFNFFSSIDDRDNC